MHFDTKKRLGFLLEHKGENFFPLFHSCEKAESLGAVEKLSPPEALEDHTATRAFFCAEE
jgi:hypothetical protein